MREIKFRVFDRKEKKMIYPKSIFLDYEFGFRVSVDSEEWFENDTFFLLQDTGLHDKNGLQDVYEGDIIDTEGNITGNIYENDKRETDLVVQGLGTSDWETTNKKAMGRGCKYSE